jgi:hypothetical protein
VASKSLTSGFSKQKDNCRVEVSGVGENAEKVSGNGFGGEFEVEDQYGPGNLPPARA